jgi:CheY-like chemotaxis protein
MTDMSGKNVLVVDDSALMRMLISMIIKKIGKGVTVTEAVNGFDAITKMEEQAFDLVLTDIVMPEMDGLQMVSTMRNSLNNTVPVVIITSKGEARERELGLLRGANGYLTKPLDVHALKHAVMNFLG